MRQPVDGADIGAIAVGEPIGNDHLYSTAEMAEIAPHQRCGGGSIDIIVADDPYRLAPDDRRCQPLDCLIEIEEVRRVRQAVADARIEKASCLLMPHLTPGQHAGDDVGNAQTLPEAQGLARIGLSQKPAAAGEGTLDESLPINH